jgi:hypothetical protein
MMVDHWAQWQEYRDRLDLGVIDAVAKEVAFFILLGPVLIHLEPNDSTRYTFAIQATPFAVNATGAEPARSPWMVSLVNDFGRSAPWDGSNEHTSVVVASFLTALSEAMGR